jgi:hypothetical protein
MDPGGWSKLGGVARDAAELPPRVVDLKPSHLDHQKRKLPLPEFTKELSVQLCQTVETF